MSFVSFLVVASVYVTGISSAVAQDTAKATTPARSSAQVAPLPAELQMFPAASPQVWQPATGVNHFQLSMQRAGPPPAPHISVVQPSQPNSICYAIRSYNYTHDTANPDVTSRSGSSTCQPSAQLQVRNVSPVFVPR